MSVVYARTASRRVLIRAPMSQLDSFKNAGNLARVRPESALRLMAQKAQPSGGLVKIWPGEIARPFFFVQADIRCSARSALNGLRPGALQRARRYSAHLLLALRAELVQVLPGVKPGIVPVVEHQLHRVLADRARPRGCRHSPCRPPARRSPAPCPCTSADGECTRRYSNGNSKRRRRRSSLRARASAGAA